jgi:hypothetical protein
VSVHKRQKKASRARTRLKTLGRLWKIEALL